MEVSRYDERKADGVGLDRGTGQQGYGRLNGSFVTKSRFNEVNEENKTLKAQVSERPKSHLQG